MIGLEKKEECIFVGNKITMEGNYIEVPKDMIEYKDMIEDVVYDVFYSAFYDKVDKKFIKTMKMNNVLYDFIEHHLKAFFDLNRSNVSNMAKEVVESYFVSSVKNYKQRIKKVSF